MAEKKTKSKAPAKGVVGLIKKLVKPAASKQAPAKPKKRAPAPTKQAAPAAAKSAKGAPPPPPPAPPPKRKPPSITITRPEATRPPPVILPPPKLVAPVGAPSLLLPKGGQPLSTMPPILRWLYVGGATRYEVEWSPDTHFGRGHSVTVVSQQTAMTLDDAHPLKPGLVYQWRVRGGNDAGWGPWSGPESFRVPEKT